MSKAEESVHIQKARQKILRKIEAAEKKINPDSINKMTALIHRQLQRRAPDRISLKTKSITLFDENRHPAKTENRFVRRLLTHIADAASTNKKKTLDGRISVEKNQKNS